MTEAVPQAPRRWPAVLAAIACVAVMGGVVAMALGTRGTDPDPAPGAAWDPGAAGGSRARNGLPGTYPEDGDPALAGCTNVDPDNPPRLSFELDDGAYDFGPVRQGERRTAEVTFVNAGKGVLCVTNVGTGCGCLKVRFKNQGKIIYNPGERGVILLVLDTTDREGKLEKTVNVTSNDIAAPIRVFKVRCDISQAVVASPTKISFGQQPRNTPASAQLLLKSPKDDPAWELTGVKGTRRDLSGSYVDYTYDVEVVEDPRFRILELTLHMPGLTKPGPFRDAIVIKTTHPQRPELLVTSYFTVVERIIPVPRRMPLGFINPAARRPARRVQLRPGSSDVRFEVTRVTWEPPPGKSAVAGGEYGFVATHGLERGIAFVDVQYDGTPRKAGLLEAVLVVHTTDPQMPEVRIPVTATIRGR